MELKESVALEDVFEAHCAAWNEGDPAEQRRLLEMSLTPDAELVQPNGRAEGRDEVIERIATFRERWPGATVEITTGLDEHHGFARYSWRLAGPEGSTLLEGLDVIEIAPDGRIRRTVMFFDPLPEA